jgi:excisionase family DNA binding protein
MKAHLRIDELAEHLNISRRTAYRLVSQGEFTAFRTSGPGSALIVTSESVQKYVRKKIREFAMEEGVLNGEAWK